MAALKIAGVVICWAISLAALFLFASWAQDHPGDWQLMVFGGLGGGALYTLHNIFKEVRSIRIMMNSRDRDFRG